MQFGDISLDWLYDADFGLDGGAMFGVVPKVVWSKRYPADAENFIPLSLRPLLVRRPGVVMVIDAGYGNKLTEKQRVQFRLSGACDPRRDLARFGLAPEDVTHLVFTHLHPDHAGGATTLEADGSVRPTFPRARVVVQRLEVEAMRSPHLRTRHAYQEENWRPVEEAGLAQVVDGQAAIAEGIEVYHTGGHTQGHQILKLSSGGQTVLHMGDLLPTHAHINPLWVLAYDDFPMQSIEQKARWLPRAQAEGWWLSFYHDRKLLAARFDEAGKLVEAIDAPLLAEMASAR